MEVEYRVATETDVLCRIDKEFDRFLVVEDHLRFKSILAIRFLAKFEQAYGVKQGIGVPLEAA